MGLGRDVKGVEERGGGGGFDRFFEFWFVLELDFDFTWLSSQHLSLFNVLYLTHPELYASRFWYEV